MMITKDQFNLATTFCSRFGLPVPKMDSADVENDTIDFGNGYTITVEQREQVYKSIFGTDSRIENTYVIYTTVVCPASYWEPEDVDVAEVEDHTNFYNALGRIAMLEREAEVNNWLEGEAYAEQFRCENSE
jgi:hypothetical protein